MTRRSPIRPALPRTSQLVPKVLAKEADTIKAQLMDMAGTAERAYLPGGGGYVRRAVAESVVSFTKKPYVDFRFSSKLSPNSTQSE